MEGTATIGAATRQMGVVLRFSEDTSKHYLIAVVDDGEHIFVHNRQFREKGKICMPWVSGRDREGKTVLREGMELEFLVGKEPGKVLRYGYDVVLIGEQP